MHLPLLWQQQQQQQQQSTHSNANNVMVTGMGMVQDMLESQYYSPADNSNNMLEQTRLVVVPMQPETFSPMSSTASSCRHRDKRLKQPGDKSKAVVSEFYYDQYHTTDTIQECDDAEKRLRLNDMVEFIGVLEEEETTTNAEGSGEVPSSSWLWPDEEPQQEWSSADVLPRLHVLWYRRVDHLEEEMDEEPKSSISSAAVPSSDQIAAVLAGSLHLHKPNGTTEPCLTSAEAVWMTLHSLAERSEKDQSPVKINTTPQEPAEATTLGCASLQMILPDAAACQRLLANLYQTLSQMVPLVVVVDCDNDIILSAPRKRGGRLPATPLQLPKGATLLVDLGNYSNNQIPPALQELLQHHRVPYQFEGGVQLYFEADVRVIVLTTARMLPDSCTTLAVQCDCRESSEEAAMKEEQPARKELEILQTALWTARRLGNVRLPPAVLEQAKTDFLQRRQHHHDDDRAAAMLQASDLHRWLGLTRLQARARQTSQASLQDWQRALQLDDSMRSTLEK